MADENDRESKTEEPTSKKLQDARSKGNNPVSRELVNCGGIIGIAAAVYLIPYVFGSIATTLITTIGNIGVTSSADLLEYTKHIIKHVAHDIISTLLAVSLFSLIALVVQSKPSAIITRISPKFERVSLRKGLKRLFGAVGFGDLIKSYIKLLIIFVILLGCLYGVISVLDQSVTSEIISSLSFLRFELGLLIAFVGSVFVLLAIADVFWVRHNWLNELKMTQKEIKDELKESEGNPQYKSYRRSVAIRLSRNRIATSVPKASVVIMNPTHFAVALRYVRGQDDAPVVVAKGRDHIALRIRSIAMDNSVPIVDNKPLARSLYKSVSLDQSIPSEFYHAIACIISAIQRTSAAVTR